MYIERAMTNPATTQAEPAREGDTITVQVAGRPALDGVYVVELVTGRLVASCYDSHGWHTTVELDGVGVSYEVTKRSALTPDQHATLRKLEAQAAAAMLEGQLRKGSAWTAKGNPTVWAVLADFKDAMGLSSTYERHMSQCAA